MKTTPFTRYHVENGARMAEFAGYHMPIEFTGINDEHCAVRERAGVFDVSHMGRSGSKGPAPRNSCNTLRRTTSARCVTGRYSIPVCRTVAGESWTTF